VVVVLAAMADQEAQTPEEVVEARGVILVLGVWAEIPTIQQVMTALVVAVLVVLGVILQGSMVMAVAVLGYWAKAQVEPAQIMLAVVADLEVIPAAILLAVTLVVGVVTAVVELGLTVVLAVAEALVLVARFASFGPEYTDNSRQQTPATYECVGSYCYCYWG
jgi:hypothetical protein